MVFKLKVGYQLKIESPATDRYLKMKVFVIFNLLMFICLAQGASMNKDFPGNVADGLEDSDEEMIEYQSEEEGSDENKDPDDDNSEGEEREEDGENSRDAKAKRDLFIKREAYKRPPPEETFEKVVVSIPVTVEKPKHKCQYGCTKKFEPVGCFRDKHVKHHRPMPRYFLSMRSRHSRVYAGFILKWNDYKNSLQKLLCQCASLAVKKGYNYFGIQYFGECWGAHTIEYKRDGVSSACVNTSFKKCNLTKDCKCTGKQHANFVYKIVKQLGSFSATIL